jgi:glucose/arabinose dehydrogenase/azurin
MRYRYLPAILSLLAGCASAATAERPVVDLMTRMDHGPFVSSTLTDDPLSTSSIFVYKGIAVRVAPDAVVVFDTDLLRVARTWTGGFLKWQAPRHGLQEWPAPDGFTHFTTAPRPGWSRDKKFTDPRSRRYGPLPATLGRYQGLHLHGDRVAFSYRIGGAEILEAPGFERLETRPVFTRTFNIGATTDALSLVVAEVPDGPASDLESTRVTPANGYVAIRSGEAARVIGFRGLPADARWRREFRQLILDLPPLQEPLRVEVAIGPAERGDHEYLRSYYERAAAVADLAPFRKPGPVRWPAIETQAVMGADKAAFAVDELTVPEENPWRSYLRPSGVDFLPDGRAVIASLSGDVWLVDGIGETLGTLRWKRFATGLNQPLGVRVVDGKIYINGRDQITRLHDANGDGEADFYENFNNEVMAATNFHAFMMNLETDSKGNFYFAKSTPWPAISRGVKAEVTPHHGALFRLSPDGAKLEVIADGLRNPNGLTIGPDDEMVYADNEGNWVPTSKVHRIRIGGFHGFIPSSHRDSAPREFELPIAWIPHFVDNSPAQPIFVTSPRWPEELRGQLLLASYGRGTLSLLLKEEVEGQWQGAHLTLPLDFGSGLVRGRFHRDGHLYLAGLTSWQSLGHGGKWGSFHRVRSTGRPLHLPVAVSTKVNGLELRFREPLDRASAGRVENYSLTQWTYPWTSRYGTAGKVYSARKPGATGPDQVIVSTARVSEDGSSVFLELPELRRDLERATIPPASSLPDLIDAPLGLVMAINYDLKSADGAEMKHVLHKTIHRLPGVPRTERSPAHTATMATHGSMLGHATLPSAPQADAPPPRESVTADGRRVVELRTTGVQLSYDVTEIRAKAGERLVLRYVNQSDMVHNVVVVRSAEDINHVGLAAIAAHATEFIPQDKKDRILAYTRLAEPGQTVSLELTVPTTPGTYPYVCTVSGHFSLMQGQLIVTP